MSVTIYNEGRVIGMSAYEVYLKHHLMEDPNTPPATEVQWLSSSIGMGTSMIVKVPKVSGDDESHSFVDIPFPENCMLSAASTIVASFFDGEAAFNGSWAIRVTDYGQLISNTSSKSPKDVVEPGFASSDVPTQTLQDLPSDKRAKLEDYMKIVDGIVIQPGKWTGKSGRVPYKDFSPRTGTGTAEKMSGRPTLRLHVKGSLQNEPLILLTGFTIRYVLSGTSGLDGSLDTSNPQDGDFLGPAVFPWVSKVVFSVPGAYIAYFTVNQYSRKLPSSGSDTLVNDVPIIDMRATNPHTYYQSHDTTAPVAYNVTTKKTVEGDISVLTVYQKKDIYPPALYGTFVSGTGSNYINPIDVIAPGTVKMFKNATQAQLKDYQDTFPGTFGLSRLDDGSLQMLDANNNLVYVCKIELSVSDINHSTQVSGSKKAKALITQTKLNTSVALSLSNAVGSATAAPTQYTFSQTPSKTMVPAKNLTWSMLLEALANDIDIDILESNLKTFKAGLPDIKAGKNGTLYVNKNFIQFGNGLRLYIASSAPSDSDIPNGSIGIGWGLT